MTSENLLLTSDGKKYTSVAVGEDDQLQDVLRSKVENREFLLFAD